MNFLRRTLASFLAPWILPKNDSSSSSFSLNLITKSLQLVLELPAFLHIDCDAINNSSLMSSSPILLHEFLIHRVNITASLFRKPGIHFEIHGITVIFRPRPSGDGFWSTREENNNKEKKQNAIFALDPQGAAVHIASENHMRNRSTSSFLGTLIVSLLLQMLQVDMQNVSIELHSNAIDSHFHRCCVVFESLSTQEGFSLFGAIGTRVLAVLKQTERPFGRICSIKDLGLKLTTADERDSTSETQRIYSKDTMNDLMGFGGFILLWKAVSIAAEFQTGHLNGVDVDFVDTMVQMNVMKLRGLLAVARGFQGLPRVPDPVQILSGYNQIKRNSRHLWQKAVQKITGGSWRRFKGVMRIGKLRYKYTHLYVAWIIKTSVGHSSKLYEITHLKNLRKREVLESLQEDLVHMEQELPIEAIVLARYIARHKAEEIIKAKFSVVSRKWEKALFWLFAFWRSLKKALESFARYLKKSFALLYFCIKRTLIYVGCLWLIQKFILWVSGLQCRFLGMLVNYFGRSNDPQKIEDISKKTWTRVRNRRDISLFTSTFPTGSLTLLASPQYLALQNIDERFIEETKKGVHFTWGNLLVAYTWTPNKMSLQLDCEYVQGELLDVPVVSSDREEPIGSSNGQLSEAAKFLFSNPAPEITLQGIVKHNFKQDDPLLEEFAFEGETEEGYPSMLVELNIDTNINPFLLVRFETSRSTFITPVSQADMLNCRLAMGCLECNLDYRSASQLGFLLRQYVEELIVDGQSTEDELLSGPFNCRGIDEVLYAHTLQFMSAIMIRQSIRLSAAVSGPKIKFVLPFFDSETVYADSVGGSNLVRPALIISSGLFAVTIWPPKVESDILEQKKARVRKTWLQKPPKPHITMEKITIGQTEHLQIGSNGILSLRGATLVLDDSNDSVSQIVGPIHINGEFSLCRDHFISSTGTNDIMSASAMVIISSLPIAIELEEMRTLLKYWVAILRISKQFSFGRHQHESSENKLLLEIPRHQASISRPIIPLYFGLCLKIEIERFECIFIDKSTNVSPVQCQETVLDNSVPIKKVATMNLKEADLRIDGKSVCIMIKQLWAEISWGDGCELSLLSGLELANISIVKVENEKSKNKESANSLRVPGLQINGTATLLLSQICVELFSATLILPWYPPQSSLKMGVQLQSAESEMVAKLEIGNVYLTDAMPMDVINRALSTASVTTNIVINVILSYECGTLVVSSKGGLIVLNTEALSLLLKTFQLLLSFLSILRNCDIQYISPLNRKQQILEEKPCFEDSSSWPPEKIQNQKQRIQQDHDFNSMSVKSYVNELTFFNDFPWLTGGFTIEISKMCLLLVQTNSTCTVKDIRGLIFEVNAISKLWGDHSGRFVDFHTTQFSICSLDISVETSFDRDQRNSVPKFELNDMSVGMVPLKEVGESSTFSRDDMETLQNIRSELESIDEEPIDSENKDNHILENLRISSRIERKSSGWSTSDDGWKGYCSFVGLDIGITTAELELIFALLMPLSTVSTFPRKDGLNSLNYVQPKSQHLSSYRFEIPDGSIVAVKDVHEHLYLAVEKMGNTYRLTGVLHYSLVGEQALFKVKHSNQEVNSSPSWFSLLSLGAKNADGECFRVHYNPGTGFADISSIYDGPLELWQTLPLKNSARADDVDIDQYDIHYENWVHLINKKSKQGLTFDNGVPVMVKKPGSLFKFKILESVTKAINGVKVPSLNENSEELGTFDPTIVVRVPKVEINIGTASIILLHETGHGKHIHPLLRGRLENVKSVIQILPLKTRMMAKCKMVFEYFEAHINRWSMIIQPVDTEIFYHMRVKIDGNSNESKTTSFLFVRMDMVDAIINDYSLDIILFMMGELNLAGPYTLKYPPILASRCLVENHTGLQLCCTFLEKNMKGAMRIPAGKTDTFLIRNMTSRRDLSSTQVLSSVSLHLEDAEDGRSSPVNISLTDPSTIAVRTRLESQKGRRRSPGPIIVVDVSNESQNGILVTVSPMVRVYNASGLVLQLRCRRSNNDSEGVVVILKNGDAIDDSMGAFNAMNMEGEKRKTLSSFNLGNYLLSVRPVSSSIPGFCHTSADEDIKQITFDWSEDIKGMKPFRISGFLEKLQYGLTKSIKGRNSRHSFGTVLCSMRVDKDLDGNAKSSHGMHLFIQVTRRLIPLSTKANDKDLVSDPDAVLQEQLELVLLPTIRVYNLLESNIIVTMCGGLEAAPGNSVYIERSGKVSMYTDLAETYFSVEIPDLMLKSNNLNIGDWRNSVKSVDPTHTDDFKEVEMDIRFQDSRHYGKLKIFHGDDGVLQMLVYTQYALRNMSNIALTYCATRNSGSLWGIISSWSRKKSIQWPEGENGNVINPGMTVSLLQRSSIWLLRMVGMLSEIAILDPESFSGTTELSIDIPHESGIVEQVLLGVTLDLSSGREMYPTRTIHISSRYVVLNDSKDPIFVCQDGFQEDETAVTLLEPGDRVSLKKNFFQGQKPVSSLGYSAYVGSDMIDPSNFSVRFSFPENQLDWSGPVCVNALGSFSLRICKTTASVEVLKAYPTVQQSDKFQFVSVDIEDEQPSLVIRFRMQSEFTVPYRIENALPGVPIFFYQKGVGDCVTSVGPGKVVGYAWDDLTQPHKLIICISNAQIYNDVNLDKLSPWKSFQPVRQKGGFGLPRSLQSQLETVEQYKLDGVNLAKRMDLMNIGYEIYADGRQRVLRVCEDLKFSKSSLIQSHISSPSLKVNSVVHNLGITLLEAKKQMTEVSGAGSSDNLEKFSPFVSIRMRRILVEFLNTHKHVLFQLKVQNLSVDEKWKGAPFAAMVRVHNADRFDISETVLHMAVVISNQVSSPIYVKYSSILLQAIDLNLDEDTLMKLVPFYRYSLAKSSSSRQIYFEHFEINPIKIVGSFLPGQPLADYTSAQETLRALLHSLIKEVLGLRRGKEEINCPGGLVEGSNANLVTLHFCLCGPKVPTIKGFTVQLNGVLLCHALLTFRQLAIKCVQHYSWYALRAVYIAKGSKLLPPAFTSLFDDSAASSLDVFFDPSNGSVDLQGLTLGMFNLLSEGLNRRGFSGTSRYIGDLERMMKTAGSNILFAILTEVSDNVLKGAETGGIDGMVSGFRRGILNISMEPSFLRSAAIKGGLNRRIKLDRNAGVDEPYIEGYLQAMLDTMFKQDYLRVKVVDDEVLLKNLPPNSMFIEEIIGCVKGFLGREGFLAGETSARPIQSLRRLQEENEFKKLVPAAIALGEQLFVIFAVRALRNEARSWFKWGVINDSNKVSVENEQQNSKESAETENASATVIDESQKTRRSSRNVILSFVLSSAMAYIDGRLCRHIPNSLARRVVSGFLLSFVE